MPYADVHAAVFTERAPGDLAGVVEAGLVNMARQRLPLIADDDDQREVANCRRILSDDIPTNWLTAVLLELDTMGELPPADDSQIDTAVGVVWETLFPPGG